MSGERDVDRPGLLCNQSLFFRVQGLYGLQVIKSIPELQAKHPDVADSKQDLFAVRLLLEHTAAEQVVINLGQAINQQAGLFTEHRADVLESCRRILDDIVQNGSVYRGKIHPVPGGQMGNAQGVKEIRFSRLAQLVTVGFLCEADRLLQIIDRFIEDRLTETAAIMRHQQLHDFVNQAHLTLIVVIFRSFRLGYWMMDRLHSASFQVRDITDIKTEITASQAYCRSIDKNLTGPFNREARTCHGRPPDESEYATRSDHQPRWYY